MKPSAKPQNKGLELLVLGSSVFGVVSSSRHIATSWRDDDNLERAANVAGLAAAVLGLVVRIRRYRRGG